MIDIGGGKTWRRHRNALKPYTATTSNIATSDEEAKDGLTLGPTAKQPEDKPDMEKDIHGLENLETTKQQQVKDIIMQFQDVFQNMPGVADIPASVAKKPYHPALHWKDKRFKSCLPKESSSTLIS